VKLSGSCQNHLRKRVDQNVLSEPPALAGGDYFLFGTTPTFHSHIYLRFALMARGFTVMNADRLTVSIINITRLIFHQIEKGSNTI
jgi:hypothetical protein